MEPLTLGILLIVGLVSGFINTLAGGGSMLTLPALMMIGVPADLANGTNRLAVLAQSVTGASGFDQAGRLERGAIIGILVPTVTGAGIGALAASLIPIEFLKPILLVVMLGVASTLLFPKPKASPKDTTSEADRLSWQGWLGLFGAGLYGGFIQAGVGFVLVAVLSGLLHFDMVRSNALKLVCTGVFSGVALCVFAFQGQVLWMMGAVLAVGSMMGAMLSVRFTIQTSDAALRRILFIMVVLSCFSALFI